MQPALTVSRDDSLLAWAEWPALAALAALGIARLAACPVEPFWDQTALLTGHVPPLLSEGVSSSWLGLWCRWTTLTITEADGVFRSLTLVLFGLSHYLLISRLVTVSTWRWALMSLIVLSPMPFLWVSSDLLASAFLALTLWALLDEQPWPIVSLCLAGFAFSKPDTLLPGLGLVAVDTWQHKDWRRLALLSVVPCLMVLPGVLVWRGAFFELQTRSWVSFAQHYAELIYQHQAMAGPEPWFHAMTYTKGPWPDAQSVGSVISLRPDLYLDFVALAVSRSVQDVFRAGLVPIITAAGLSGWWLNDRRWLALVTVPLVGILPQVLVAYVHVRYTPRIVTVLIAMIGLAVQQNRHHQERLIILGALIAFGILGWMLAPAVSAWMWGNYFPD